MRRVRLKSLIPKPYDFEPTTFGDHLRKRRLILGLTQAEMATQLGVNEWTVGNWENDATKPVLRFIPAIIRFLGYDPEAPQPGAIADTPQGEAPGTRVEPEAGCPTPRGGPDLVELGVRRNYHGARAPEARRYVYRRA